MKLIERKPCGCRIYQYACGYQVEKLCKRHLRKVAKEAGIS